MRLRATVVAAIACVLLLSSCGYHTAGHASKLPPDVKTIAVPVFTNQTQTYHVEAVLTSAVVRELTTRTNYRVVSEPRDADATITGTVLSTQTAPVTYDAKTGRASSAMVTVTMKVTMNDRNGRVLYSNPSYLFREQYQISREVSSFFEEQGPAFDRMSRDFARSLVASILEAY